MLPAILSHFDNLPDPRVNRTRLHPLISILGIALCGVLCGADSWVEIEEYGKAKQEWLTQWLPLPNGIPSHDTFARLFARLQPETLGSCLQTVTQQLVEGMEKLIAIDGKYLRHSFDKSGDQRPWVMLNAWASHQRLVLASLPVDLKSNEIKKVPELLALLDITGCTVTLDANCPLHKDHAPVNFSLLRQMALNLLRQEKTCKNGIAVKRSKAGWDDTYLFKVLDSCSHI